jgi:two-component system chemotaxis sensor kinase CheA
MARIPPTPVQDPELVRLLVQELGRQSEALEAWSSNPTEAQRALHALRGSAGLAGERDLASALERVHRRVREGDGRAWAQAVALVRSAARRLAAGESALPTSWPVPPDDMVVRPLDSMIRAQYAAEVTDRLARIDDALATGGDAVESARALYRHIHTLKGAASAAGDEPMTWFCHGLEDRLRVASGPEAARQGMDEVAQWRVVLGAMLDEPDTALAMLGASRTRSTPPRPPRPHDSPPPEAASDAPGAMGSDDAAATIRVRAADIDRLLERLEVIDRARERIASRAERGSQFAATMREHRASLAEALLLIGPARPWGPPASALARADQVAEGLRAMADEIEGGASRLRATEQLLREGVTEAKKQLSEMRQTTVGRIFARLTTAVESEARRAGRAVIVSTRGADETIDRRVAERLVEPCLQLVRNAVAHGIEPPEVRWAAGKPAMGTVALQARAIGNRLRITISDDGAGVDVAAVRARAVATGLMSAAAADHADDDAILALLFMPGFSTRRASDLLAGRGIGLDIVRATVQRMGGAVHLSSRAGRGLTARVEVPLGSGFTRVMWVRAGGDEFVLPAAHARRVRLVEPGGAPAPHLSECLGGPAAVARYAVDLELEPEDFPAPLALGVDGVGNTDELLVRPLGALITSVGPFAGAVARGDGALHLALDVWAIAPRLRALTNGRAHERS